MTACPHGRRVRPPANQRQPDHPRRLGNAVARCADHVRPRHRFALESGQWHCGRRSGTGKAFAGAPLGADHVGRVEAAAPRQPGVDQARARRICVRRLFRGPGTDRRPKINESRSATAWQRTCDRSRAQWPFGAIPLSLVEKRERMEVQGLGIPLVITPSGAYERSSNAPISSKIIYWAIWAKFHPKTEIIR